MSLLPIYGKNNRVLVYLLVTFEELHLANFIMPCEAKPLKTSFH